MRYFGLLFVLSAALYGQTFTGTITGRVTDPNAAAVPGTDVVLQNANTNNSNAGVVTLNQNLINSTSEQNTTRFSLNGGRENSAQVMIDGVPALAGDWGGLLATPGVDTIQEVQVLRNTYEAQFGKSGGGVVNMTTKGGVFS